MDTKDLHTAILKIFANSPFVAFNHKQISSRVGAFDKASRQMVMNIMLEMAENRILLEEGRGKYKLNPKYLADDLLPKQYLIGTMDMKSSGKAYLIVPEEGQEDVLIGPTHTHHALHGDTVKVQMFPQRKLHKPEGQVVEILHRAKTRFVGRIRLHGEFAFLLPDTRNMVVDLFIPQSGLNGAQDGEKCVVEMTEWPDNMNNPVAHVVKRLGKPGDNNVEMQSILAEYDFPLEFPAEAEKEAAKIRKPTKKEIASRRDFRPVTTFTIDPADAKDFDDALSFRILDNGHYEIGVHIADVSHYVQPGTAIDREAYNRATSVYLVDRTIPMLPEKLCNDVCSLRQDEEKLCFSAVFEMNDKAEVLSQWFGKTVICSNQRYAYEQAQSLIDGERHSTGAVDDAILRLHALATIMRTARYKAGAINFESQEVKFQLDDNGKPIGVYIKEAKEANWLIEEFMLLANRKVAEYVGAPTQGKEAPRRRGAKAKSEAKTFVYRIHDEPNPEKLNTFVEFVTKLGFKMQVATRKQLANSYNKLFADIAGRGEEYMIDTIAIRTMSKAIYSTDNIGHYGLAFPYYTHFTSPIRRYPDLMVHRLLERYLADGPSADATEYEEYCKHCSLMEKKAADAERSSVKYKQAEYLSDKLGQTFPANISGVSKWGIYAEIEGNKCEGMIPIHALKGDFYMLDEDNFQVIGRRTGRTLKLGDPVRIRVKGVDMVKRLIDFDLIDDTLPDTPTPKKGKGKGHSHSKAKASKSKSKVKAKPATEASGKKARSRRH